MHKRISAKDCRNIFMMIGRFTTRGHVAFLVAVTILGLALTAVDPGRVEAAANPAGVPNASGGGAGTPTPLAASLGVHFVPGSSSQVLLERDGKTYLVDLAQQTIQAKESPAEPRVEAVAHLEPAHSVPQDANLGAKIFSEKCADCHGAGGNGGGTMKAPDFTSPSVQATLSDAVATKIIRDGKPGTAMPAWGGKLSDAEIDAVSAFVKSLAPAKKKNSEHAAPQGAVNQSATIYEPADDYLFSLPTGRRLNRHGLYLNFTHRFAYTPAFSGPGGGNMLLGLDDFAIASFGLRFGVTDKLSVAAYRSPSIIGRPIELMAAYNLLDEHDHQPFNFAVRGSVDGQDNFSKNFTGNLEFIASRSITRRAQFYVAPTISFQNRELIQKPGPLPTTPPNLPGFNTFSLGIGGAVDIRPTVALVAEVFPTLVNGPEMGIHRPPFAFGIQKRVRGHAFTLGFSTSPGTIVSQRAGTRATLVGSPSADTPSGLFIGFDLMRQIY